MNVFFLLKILKKLKLLRHFNLETTKVINGKQLRIPVIYGMGMHNVVLRNEWLDSMISLFVENVEGAFVDVGVNVGQSLLRVKTQLQDAKYIGFEPNPACVFYTDILIKMNNFNDCIVLNTALSDKPQKLILEKTFIDDVRASTISELRPGHLKEIAHVTSFDYDTLFIEERCAFIKIDVEGAELDVIKGMRQSILKYKPIIACEILDSHSAESLEFTQRRANEIVNLILSMNYKIVRFLTKDNALNGIEVIDNIVIKQWTRESLFANDYLFYPEEEELNVIAKLNSAVM